MNSFKYIAIGILMASTWRSEAQQPRYTYQGNAAATEAPRGRKPSLEVVVGAARTEAYLPLLKNKRVAVLVNQTSEINGKLLPDLLLEHKVNLVTIFSPEHGFRGNADAGAHVKNDKDPQTGLPVISLYGNNKKPNAQQLSNVDVVIYDLQDVGARFYTYVSSLEYLMEACAEQKKQLIILDRPNPLGNIVDGPVLQKENRSFVGMQAVPIVYGMTPGEYAQMLIGEKWIKAPNLDLKVITCDNYNHQTLYRLPVAPSPNLKNMAAIYLYPSVCLFEGTVISLGRGTDKPFQQYGHPQLKGFNYSFTPTSVTGATNPPLKDKKCYGELLAADANTAYRMTENKLQLKWLIKAYEAFPDKNAFFNNFFIKLAGTNTLQEQIRKGMSEADIRASWQPELDKFKTTRAKYLLYEE
ncbi:MAG: hypothetical protein BGO31_01205 [Bacteroidetes bacterium 43-16]|nr:MAG: hypothetical protein BGO31_01205 [Bacteroidetes bacterium 43-16]